MRLTVLTAIVISVVMTPAVNLGLSGYFQSFFIILGTLVALTVTVYQFLKVKSDSLYIRLLPYFLKNKVLIIDDFDRISIERQEESYKLFHILHGKLPIVFIGDYQKIAKSDEESGKYLQKIIDRRLELPSSLNSRTIWEDYLTKLSLELDIDSRAFNRGILSIIKSENRTLRELKQFSDLLNYELFERGKRDLVDIEQLITIVYIFLFYPKYYLELKDFGSIFLEKEIEEIRMNETWFDANNRVKNIKEKFYEILIANSEKSYPRLFVENKAMYFVDEYVNNLTLKEAQEIFSDERKIQNIIRKNDNIDFFSYLMLEYSKFRIPTMDDFRIENNLERKHFEKNRISIEKIAIKEIKLGNKNKIIDFVVYELGKKIYLESKEEVSSTGRYEKNVEEFEKVGEIKKLINKIEYNKWENYTHEFSLSEKIKFHIDYRFGGEYIIPQLTKLSEEMVKDREALGSERYKPYIYFLLIRNFSAYRSNKYNIKDLVNELTDSDFILFWELMGLIDGNRIKVSTLDFESGDRINNNDIYNEIKESLEKIAREQGFRFKLNQKNN